MGYVPKGEILKVYLDHHYKQHDNSYVQPSETTDAGPCLKKICLFKCNPAPKTKYKPEKLFTPTAF